MPNYQTFETLVFDLDMYLQSEASGEDIRGLLSDVENLRLFLKPLAPRDSCYKLAHDLVSDLSTLLAEHDNASVQRLLIRYTLVTLARYLHQVNPIIFQRKATRLTLKVIGIA